MFAFDSASAVETSAPPLYSFIDEDNERSSSDRVLQPRKMGSVDPGEGVALAVGVAEGKFSLRETTMIFVGGDIELSLEDSRPLGADVYVSFHSAWMETEGATADVLDPSWREEAST